MKYQALKMIFYKNCHSRLILASAGLILASRCLADSNPADSAIRDLVLRAQSALAKGQSHQAAELYEKAAGLGESAEAEIGLVRAYLQAGEFRKTALCDL